MAEMNRIKGAAKHGDFPGFPLVGHDLIPGARPDFRSDSHATTFFGWGDDGAKTHGSSVA